MGLIKQIQQRAKFTSLVMYSIKALKELAADDEAIADLLEGGIVDALVAVNNQTTLIILYLNNPNPNNPHKPNPNALITLL